MDNGSEVNNYGFECEKAIDRRGPFGTIPNSFQAGHGSTTVPQYYSYHDTTSIAGTWFYRLRQTDFDGTVHFTDAIQVDVMTGVPNETGPAVFALGQNYPNPVNPTTMISYELSATTQVSLKVYDVLGQEVATLVNGIKFAGRHEAEWNATGLASGVYFYRLHAGTFVDVKRMTVIK